jgi:diaminohydroxyphosphoribosylaminopyrimidine deaminase/5-amino-6-(5-phosphoribosylamino)uracil reductase
LNRSLIPPPAPDISGDRPPGLESSVESWRTIPEKLRSATAPLPSPWEDIFGPLRAGAVDGLVVVGQIGQSLDGRVATRTGHSHYINGAAGLAHLHRLRALVDAVVIGIGSALADDPRLTVRHVAGPAPARVVIDPRGRLAPTARLLADDGARRFVVTTHGAACALSGVETLVFPAIDGHIAPAAILARLAEAGLRRVLIEGGADTILRFLKAGCLDRLHVIVAPIILGGGRPSFTLNPIDSLEDALRPPMRVHPLNGEVLFDCDFSAQRVHIAGAGRSSRDGLERARK